MSGAPGIVSRAGRANTEEQESTERVEVAEEQQEEGEDRELKEREGEEDKEVEAKDEVSYSLALHSRCVGVGVSLIQDYVYLHSLLRVLKLVLD